MRTKHARIYLWLADRCRTDEAVYWYAFYAAMLMRLSGSRRRRRQRKNESTRYASRRRRRSSWSPKRDRVAVLFARRGRSATTNRLRSSISLTTRPPLVRFA
jgi:hypothetical protein